MKNFYYVSRASKITPQYPHKRLLEQSVRKSVRKRVHGTVQIAQVVAEEEERFGHTMFAKSVHRSHNIVRGPKECKRAHNHRDCPEGLAGPLLRLGHLAASV